MDKVFIEGLRVVGKHGVMEHEHSVEQEFIFDISATCDTRASAESDDVEDTISYVAFRDIAKRIVEGPHNYLIERIASLVAKEILADTRVLDVTITIRKPAVMPNVVPGITITRTQGEF